MTSPSIVEMQDRGGAKYKVHRVGERTYPVYQTWENRDYAELLDLVRNMEIRSDDVILAGYPKCGNNWAYEILSMITLQTTDYVPKRLLDDHLDVMTPEMFEELKNRPSPRLIHTHLNPDSLPIQISEKKAKIVFIVRNLKDMALSGYHFARILTTFLPYKGKWDDYLEIGVFGPGIVYGSWFDYVKQCEQYIKDHPRSPVFVICYEELKKDTVGEIKRLCAFLGYPDHLAEAIAEKVNFKKMKPAVLGGKLAELTAAMCEPGTDGVMRKGEIGDWKNMFTVAQSERTDMLYDQLMSGSEIGQKLKKYM